MEQLILQQEQYTRGRMMEVAMVMKKVEIRLSKEQIASLGRMMSALLANMRLEYLSDKDHFYMLYLIYEGKIRKKMLSMKPTIKLSFDVSQAYHIVLMLDSIDLSAWPYEYQLSQHIKGEIDHQTA